MLTEKTHEHRDALVLVPLEAAEREEAWVPLEDYAQQIALRLLALDAAEPEPKVIPRVLKAWGITAEG